MPEIFGRKHPDKPVKLNRIQKILTPANKKWIITFHYNLVQKQLIIKSSWWNMTNQDIWGPVWDLDAKKLFCRYVIEVNGDGDGSIFGWIS